MVGQTVEIERRFQISPAWYGRALKAEDMKPSALMDATIVSRNAYYFMQLFDSVNI